jgi:hypothetical protein
MRTIKNCRGNAYNCKSADGVLLTSNQGEEFPDRLCDLECCLARWEVDKVPGVDLNRLTSCMKADSIVQAMHSLICKGI